MADFINKATAAEVEAYLDGTTMEINEEFELSLDEAQAELKSGNATTQVIQLTITKD